MKLYLPCLLVKKSNEIGSGYSPAIQGAKVSPATVFILSMLTSNEVVLALATWQEI
jgi:hypothetical protein